MGAKVEKEKEWIVIHISIAGSIASCLTEVWLSNYYGGNLNK